MIDHDVIVSEVRKRTGSVYEDSQFGLIFIDTIDPAGRQTRPRNGFLGFRRRDSMTDLRSTARGQQQRKNTDTQVFEHQQRPAVLLN
jgi:hypothetical protein